MCGTVANSIPMLIDIAECFVMQKILDLFLEIYVYLTQTFKIEIESSCN